MENNFLMNFILTLICSLFNSDWYVCKEFNNVQEFYLYIGSMRLYVKIITTKMTKLQTN